MKNYNEIIKNLSKIIIIYFIVLLLFYFIHSNSYRFILSLLLYIFSVFIFNINLIFGCFYFLLAISACITEHIFIKYITLYWDYRNPNLFTIPLWLIPLWVISIILILETISIFKTIYLFYF